jgi:hypothetical protein
MGGPEVDGSVCPWVYWWADWKGGVLECVNKWIVGWRLRQMDEFITMDKCTPAYERHYLLFKLLPNSFVPSTVFHRRHPVHLEGTIRTVMLPCCPYSHWCTQLTLTAEPFDILYTHVSMHLLSVQCVPALFNGQRVLLLHQCVSTRSFLISYVFYVTPLK